MTNQIWLPEASLSLCSTIRLTTVILRKLYDLPVQFPLLHGMSFIAIRMQNIEVANMKAQIEVGDDEGYEDSHTVDR